MTRDGKISHQPGPWISIGLAELSASEQTQSTATTRTVQKRNNDNTINPHLARTGTWTFLISRNSCASAAAATVGQLPEFRVSAELSMNITSTATSTIAMRGYPTFLLDSKDYLPPPSAREFNCRTYYIWPANTRGLLVNQGTS